jgi:hypothetical protein
MSLSTNVGGELRKQTAWLDGLAAPLPGRAPEDHQRFAH